MSVLSPLRGRELPSYILSPPLQERVRVRGNKTLTLTFILSRQGRGKRGLSRKGRGKGVTFMSVLSPLAGESYLPISSLPFAGES